MTDETTSDDAAQSAEQSATSRRVSLWEAWGILLFFGAMFVWLLRISIDGPAWLIESVTVALFVVFVPGALCLLRAQILKVAALRENRGVPLAKKFVKLIPLIIYTLMILGLLWVVGTVAFFGQ